MFSRSSRLVVAASRTTYVASPAGAATFGSNLNNVWMPISLSISTFPFPGHWWRRYFSSSNDKNREEKKVSSKNSKQNATSVFRRKSTTSSSSSSSSTNTKEQSRKAPKIDAEDPPTSKAVPVVQPSIYYYSTQQRGDKHTHTQRTTTSKKTRQSPSRFVLPTMNASALLDPLKYCKSSSRLSFDPNGVNRTISGTDAARRLLRGKKEFILAARSLRNQPALLEGHGVPPQLFQHCIDMADALLLQYSQDAVECTFNTFNINVSEGEEISKLPKVVRIRSRDATNTCSGWPPQSEIVQDWDYHLELYLTVMQRIAAHLGLVLQKKHFTPKVEQVERQCDVDDDGDELTSSPFLFPNSDLPQWNVDILRGSYFDLQKDGPSGSTTSNAIPPMPIIEFGKESGNTSHLLIRMQGYARENTSFGHMRSVEPVSLVFDACFRSDKK